MKRQSLQLSAMKTRNKVARFTTEVPSCHEIFLVIAVWWIGHPGQKMSRLDPKFRLCPSGGGHRRSPGPSSKRLRRVCRGAAAPVQQRRQPLIRPSTGGGHRRAGSLAGNGETGVRPVRHTTTVCAPASTAPATAVFLVEVSHSDLAPGFYISVLAALAVWGVRRVGGEGEEREYRNDPVTPERITL